MLALYLLVAFCGLVGAVFLLEPLVRDEDDLTPLTTRYGRCSRTDHRLQTDDSAVSTHEEGSTDHGVTSRAGRSCPHCGSDVEQGYVFCGNCAGPLPTPG
jgi:hypothetical protein